MLIQTLTLLFSLFLVPQTTTTAPAPPPRQPVTFANIQSILGPQCHWCHGWDPEALTSGYDMDSYDALIDGVYRHGAHRQEIIPGDAEHSPFVQYLDGRREPRMPYQREPFDKDTIALIRRWIDDGARPDPTTPREHEIRLSDVPITAGQSFWLSCRVPLKERHLRVKLVDEAGRVLAYEWPQDSKMDLKGLWDQWEIKVPQKLPDGVTKVAIVLLVSSEAKQAERDDDLSGTVFVLDNAKTPKPELLRQVDLTAVPSPTPPPHQKVDFSFLLRCPSDVTLDVYREKEEQSLWHWSDIDLPADKTVRVPSWQIGDQHLTRGYYEARIRCRSRDQRHQPSFTVLFHLDPPTNGTH